MCNILIQTCIIIWGYVQGGGGPPRISKIYGFQGGCQAPMGAEPSGKNVSPLPGKNPVYALDF